MKALLSASLTLLSATLATAQDVPKPTWRVDPRLEGGPPTINGEGLPAGSDITWRVSTLPAGEGSRILVEETAPQSGRVQMILPAVEADTYARADVWLGEADDSPDYTWTTLLRPAGVSLYDYAGLDTMPPPGDFDEYWQRARAELAAVPMNPVVRELPDRSTETGILYEVELDTIGNTKIVCRFTIPRSVYDAEKRVLKECPAFIIMPGYGAEEPPIDRTSEGFVTMSVNPRNHGPSKEFWKSEGEHLVHGIDNPETYYYRFAFMDCLRAAEYLFSRPEVDATRVAAEGGSQGGLFAIALGVLEPRICCVMSNVTAFSSFPEGMILNTSGGVQSLAARINEGGEAGAAVRRSLSYTDGANMATRLRVPVQINMGGQDPVCHFTTGLVILHRLRADVPRQFNLLPDARHEVPGPMREWNAEWARQWMRLEKAPSLPGKVL